MSLKLIEKLSNGFGPSGFEDDILDILTSEINTISVEKDSINNLYIGLEERKINRPTIALDAHSDEVGFIVESINKNGSLNIIPLGGWYIGNIPSSAVTIKNSNGESIKGVIASKPPHFMTEEELKKLPKFCELTIDIGTSCYEDTTSIYGIEVGNPVVPDSQFIYDKKIQIMRGKALDDRLGCAAVIETLNYFSDKDLDLNLIGIISSQEEVGARGAKVAINKTKPDFVIAFEGSPADDTFKDNFASRGALGKGVQLRVIDGTMISNPKVINLAKHLAKKHNIDIQIIARDKGGTNGGVYHCSLEGIPTLVLGIPTRYIHSNYSFASINDYKSAIELATKFIQELNFEILSKF